MIAGGASHSYCLTVVAALVLAGSAQTSRSVRDLWQKHNVG